MKAFAFACCGLWAAIALGQQLSPEAPPAVRPRNSRRRPLNATSPDPT